MTDPIPNIIGSIPAGAATGPTDAHPSAPASAASSISLSNTQQALLQNILNPVTPGKITSHELLVNTLNAIQAMFKAFKDNDYLQSLIDNKLLSGGLIGYLTTLSLTASAQQVSSSTNQEEIDAQTTALRDIEAQVESVQPGYLNLMNSLNSSITAYNTALQNVNTQLASLNPQSPASVAAYQNAVNTLNIAAATYNNLRNSLQGATNPQDPYYQAKNLPYLLSQYNQALLNLTSTIADKNNKIALWNAQYGTSSIQAQPQPLPTETMAPIMPLPSASPISALASAPPKPQTLIAPLFLNFQPLHSTPVAGGGSPTLQGQINSYNSLTSSYNSQLTNLQNLQTAYTNAFNLVRQQAANYTTSAAYNVLVTNANNLATQYNNALTAVFNTLQQMQTQATLINNGMYTETGTLLLSPLTPVDVALNQVISPAQENLSLYQAGVISSANVPPPAGLAIPKPLPGTIAISAIQNFTIPTPPATLPPSFADLTVQLQGTIADIALTAFGLRGTDDMIMYFSKLRVDQALIYILSAEGAQSQGMGEIKIARDVIANAGTSTSATVTHLSAAQTDIVLNNIQSNLVINNLISKLVNSNPAAANLAPGTDSALNSISQQVLTLTSTALKNALLLAAGLLQNVLQNEGALPLSGPAQAGLALEQLLQIVSKGGLDQLVAALGVPPQVGLGNAQALLSTVLSLSTLQLGAILLGDTLGNRAFLLENQALLQSINTRSADVVQQDIQQALQQSDETQKQILSQNLQDALIQAGVQRLNAQDAVTKIIAGNQSLADILQQFNLQTYLSLIDQTQQITRYESALQALNNPSNPIQVPSTPAITRPVSDATAAAVQQNIQKILLAESVNQDEAAKRALAIANGLQQLSGQNASSQLLSIQQLLNANLPNSNLTNRLLPTVISQLLTAAQTETVINLIGEQVSLDRVTQLTQQQQQVIENLNQTIAAQLEQQRNLADAENLRHILDSNALKYDHLLNVNTLVNQILDPGTRLTFFGLMYESATNEFKRGYINIRA